MRSWFCGFMLLFVAWPAFAEGDSGKFSVAGDTMIYSTETTGGDGEMVEDDVAEFLKLLQAGDAITTLVLNSGGGSIWAGEEMARIALDFELNTVVRGKCNSACVNIFLAGQSRRMERGSKIGFHQRSWSPEAIETYYEKWREDDDWDTPYDFASWVYRDTQGETYKDLIYFVSRGVDPEFAIKTKAPRDEMWYPSRAELSDAGVLTE